MYGTYRVGKRKKAEKVFKPTLKNVNNLEEKVKNHILSLRNSKVSGSNNITKEEIAKIFSVKPHNLDEIFKKLNHEGILTQAIRQYAHDTDRNPMFGGYDSGWAANTYRVKFEFEPWSSAVEEGNFQKVERMLEKGQNINAAFYHSNALISCFTYQGLNIDMLEFLLKKGADPLHNNSVTLFENAMREKTSDALKLLLTYTKNPFFIDESGNTLLHHSASVFPQHLSFLYNLGFSLNDKNNHGETPLILAAKKSSNEAFFFLLSKNANLKLKDNNKKTAFMYAYDNDNTEILKSFLSYKDSLTREEKKLFKKIRIRLLF